MYKKMYILSYIINMKISRKKGSRKEAKHMQHHDAILADENINDWLRKTCIGKAHEIYGKQLPKEIESRVQMELDVVIQKRWGSTYYIICKVIKMIELRSYEMEIHGMFCNSFLAYLCGITEINPLDSHYICNNCKYVEFLSDCKTRYEMVEKRCPCCGEIMEREGYDLKFEILAYADTDLCVEMRVVSSKWELARRIVKKLRKDYGIKKRNVCRINVHTSDTVDLLAGLVFKTGEDVVTNGVYQIDEWKNTGVFCYFGFENRCIGEILEKINAKTFYEVSKGMALSLGTGIWENNGEYLVEFGVVELENLPVTYDDIFELLVSYGISKKEAIMIVKEIRKRKGICSEYENAMEKVKIPRSYIEFCKKIIYLFPKSCAIVMAKKFFCLEYYKKYFPRMYQNAYHDIIGIYQPDVVFIYGVPKRLEEFVSGKYGWDTLFVDVTEQYQDILACRAKAVIINVEKIHDNELQIVLEYRKEAEDEETEYLIGTVEELEKKLCTEREIRRC